MKPEKAPPLDFDESPNRPDVARFVITDALTVPVWGAFHQVVEDKISMMAEIMLFEEGAFKTLYNPLGTLQRKPLG